MDNGICELYDHKTNLNGNTYGKVKLHYPLVVKNGLTITKLEAIESPS